MSSLYNLSSKGSRNVHRVISFHVSYLTYSFDLWIRSVPELNTLRTTTHFQRRTAGISDMLDMVQYLILSSWFHQSILPIFISTDVKRN